MPLRIPFGKQLPEGRLVDATGVPSGLACGCVCPKCGAPLIARHGRTTARVSHFAHSSTDECEGAFETALHKTAKQIVAEAFELNLNFGETGTRHQIIFDETHIEKKVANFVADVFARHQSGKSMVFEILVTHAVDALKLEKIRQARLTCFEIDLSKVRRLVTYDELRRGICEGKYPARLVHDELGLRAQLEAEMAILRPQKYRAMIKRRQEEEARQAAAEAKQQEWRRQMPWLA